MIGGTAGLCAGAGPFREVDPFRSRLSRLVGLWGLLGLAFTESPTGDFGGDGRGVWCGEGVKEWITRFLRLWRFLKGSSSSDDSLFAGEGLRRSSSCVSFADFSCLPFSLGSFEMSLTGPA